MDGSAAHPSRACRQRRRSGSCSLGTYPAATCRRSRWSLPPCGPPMPTNPRHLPGSFFCTTFPAWLMVTAAMLPPRAEPADALGPAGASSPYFCATRSAVVAGLGERAAGERVPEPHNRHPTVPTVAALPLPQPASQHQARTCVRAAKRGCVASTAARSVPPAAAPPAVAAAAAASVTWRRYASSASQRSAALTQLALSMVRWLRRVGGRVVGGRTGGWWLEYVQEHVLI